MHIAHYVKDVLETVALVGFAFGAVAGWFLHMLKVRVRPPKRFRKEA